MQTNNNQLSSAMVFWKFSGVIKLLFLFIEQVGSSRGEAVDFDAVVLFSFASCVVLVS